MKRFSSLTARLTTTAVLLVALVCVLIGSLTTLAMRNQLTQQLDQEVASALQRVERAVDRPFPGTPPPGEPEFSEVPRQAVDSLMVVIDSSGARGEVLTADASEALSDEAVDVLEEVDATDAVTVGVPGHGSYRVKTAERDGVRFLAGLPTGEVDQSVSWLVRWLVLLSAGLLVLTAVLASVLVRRHLRPLREVAATAHRVSELPLDQGAIAITERVPDHLTDETTEVGQVGAALNSLLSHVESSLDARHRSEQQVRQFVADASHELRTPLATIKGYSELSRRAPDDHATQAAALGKVETEADRMSGLVEDLLLLARLDAGRPLEHGTVDVTRLLLESVSDARVLGPGHRWRLDLPEVAVEAVGDEERLRQVLRNLLENARRHTPDGTTVVVAARPGPHRGAPVEVTVTDDGPGFDPTLLPVAFDRFTRGDTSRSRGQQGSSAGPTEGGGSGLGLSLVKAILSAQGGTVSLTSRPGETRFTLRLSGPVPPAPAASR